MDATMHTDAMLAQMAQGQGFVAALDQSGGSTPKALRQYGVAETAYHGDAEMFEQVHQMRVRIITAPCFTGERIVATILFEKTMDGTVQGEPVPTYLWERRHIVPLLKVDQGLEPEHDGVRLMKPIAGLDTLLDRAKKLGIFGTKMRSVIETDDPAGIAAIVRQQLEVATQIAHHGLVPIVEPEISIGSPAKSAAETRLLAELQRGIDALPPSVRIMLKLTIPTQPDLYAPFVNHPKVVRVLALSGGYSLDDACARLAHNHGMIASFSRALIDDLRVSMTDAEFNATLARVVDQIHHASLTKS